MTDSTERRHDAAAVEPIRRADGESGLPLYVQLAQTIGERINSGSYPVGSLLPTEAELGLAFGVSRYTVRQAILHLRNQGLVSARKGVGTRVQAIGAEPSYTQSMRSLAEMLQYAAATRLQLLKTEDVAPRGALADALGSRPRKPWIRVLGVRYDTAGKLPLCLNEIFVDGAYRAIIEEAASVRTAVWALIEERFGETVIEVDQQIEAMLLDAASARLLDAPPGSPALKIVRRYYVTGRRLVELSVNLHPADRFSYHMTIRREAAPK